MKIPRIKMFFDSFKHETDSAILITLKGKEYWIPKSIINDIYLSKKQNYLFIAPFKFQEMTGVVPQSLDKLVIDEIQENIELNTISDYDIIEPKGIFLKEKQIEKIIKIKRLKSFFVYGQMRTGKTVIATTIAESRYNSGIINKIIVISPLRTKIVWDKHLSVDFTFIATEHLSNINTRYSIDLDCDLKTMIILDESHQIKNKSAYRTNHLIELSKHAGHKCILTGTPIGKHAGDLYFQFYFLDPFILNYTSYSDFEQNHLLYGGREGKQVVAYTNIEEISKRISPYTVIMTRNEMNIDREKKYEIVSYNITNREKYESLKEKYEKLYEQNKNIAILGYMVKLQQCANGYLIDENDKCIGYEDNGRNSCLKLILDSNKGEYIVIYFKYNEDLKHLSKLGVPILYGKTKNNDFNETINKFNSGEIKIIGLQQQLSLGFSLRACNIMIYFSRKFGSISSAQSEDRACERTDKELRIIDISAHGTIDELIKSTINKQFSIINLFKKEIKNEN